MEPHPTPASLSRRNFVRVAAVSAGAFAVGGVLASCERPTGHAHPLPLDPDLAKGGGGGGGATVRNALRIPNTVAPSGLSLDCAPGTADLGGGRSTSAWMYNGQFPGPTLMARSGDQATVTLGNQLSQQSITHWHGMLVDHMNDGHPHQALASGGSYSYDFTINQRACLNWYHPHPHLLTGEQVYRGLAGAFIVRDTVDTGVTGNALGLPHGPYEVPLIIRDASFDSRGNLSFGNKSSGFFGNTPLVNGTLQPFLAVDQAVYRLRVLNGCNARVLRLALTGGSTFSLIGNEGGLLGSAPVSLAEITVAPGERLDLLVDFRGLAAGAAVMLRCLNAGWDVLQFSGTGLAGGNGSIPSGGLSTIQPLGASVRDRRFTFDGMTRINGRVYEMNRTDFTVPLGDTERWVFITNGNGPHPVHVHGAYFQVQSRTGGRGQVFDWERGWKDTVLVDDGETVEVLIRFTAHRGLYVLHCHQLAHEDNGMMSNFEVV
jgi:blue copper oxidase